jgi:hypothetical protein
VAPGSNGSPSGIINYPTHIQPIWQATRGTNGANTCINCHTSADATLNLTNTIDGNGRMASYDSLMIGKPVLNSSGQPEFTVDEGVETVMLGDALVDTAADESVALGLARKSRLVEIMSGQSLMSTVTAQAAHPAPPVSAPDHSTMLTAAEKRLIAEWIDTGSKYFNDPFDPSSGVLLQVNGLNQANFQSQVYPIILSTCAANCHLALGSNINTIPAGSSFRNNRFVLTGDPVGDYNVTLTMISNACQPASNYLLARPSTNPHPVGSAATPQAVLPVGSGNYNTIYNWILQGC